MELENNNYACETSDYLPCNSVVNDDEGAEPEQYFVIQDDSTFLLPQDVSQNALFISPEQFNVNHEVERTADSVILFNDNSNIIENSYVIQPLLDTASEVNKCVVNEENIVGSIINNKIQDSPTINQGNNLTEVTLNDEQCQMLEEKGWVLLETIEQVFVLDTFGLHDISTNEDLIQKFKCETQNYVENKTKIMSYTFTDTKSDSMDFEEPRNVQITQPMLENINTPTPTIKLAKFNKSIQRKPKIEKITNTANILQRGLVLEQLLVSKISEIGNVIKLKTNLSINDFPEKLLLGKTKSGKRLVAKFVKRKLTEDLGNCKDTSRIITNKNSQTITKNPSDSSTMGYNETVPGPSKSQLEKLIREYLNHKNLQYNQTHVNSVGKIIGDLLKSPMCSPTLVKKNLFITKDVKSYETGINESQTILVTGRVMQDVNSGFHSFVHMPHMIRELMKDINGGTEKYLENHLHVHIHEQPESMNNGQIKVTVNIEKFDIQRMLLTSKKHQTTTYACRTCAKLFLTETELEAHQEDDCVENEEDLTIDTSKLKYYCTGFNVTESKLERLYFCFHCNASFKKLGNCKRHVQIHKSNTDTNLETNKEVSNSNKNDENVMYKCKVCSNYFKHPSTLSRHILTSHICNKNP